MRKHNSGTTLLILNWFKKKGAEIIVKGLYNTYVYYIYFLKEENSSLLILCFVKMNFWARKTFEFNQSKNKLIVVLLNIPVGNRCEEIYYALLKARNERKRTLFFRVYHFYPGNSAFGILTILFFTLNLLLMPMRNGFYASSEIFYCRQF